MVSIAAGMESDITDSENDMVFSVPKKSAGNGNIRPKNESPEPEYVPIVISPASNGSVPVSSTSENTWSKQKKPQKNHYYNSRERKPKNKRLVCQQSQPLDDLRYAIMQGNLEVIKSILDKGIWVDSILKAGWTGLMYAASSARHEIVLFLLERKADPNYHKDSFTALMAACASSKEEEDGLHKCCCHLLKYGAEVNIHERHLTTPLMFAAREGHFQIVKELLEAGANVHARDNKGQTALSWAAAGGFGQIVRLLLSKGADPHAVDFAGQTAADLAYNNGHKEVASVLEKSALQTETPTATEVFDDENQKCVPKSKHDLNKCLPSNSVQRPNQKLCVKQGELELFLNGLDLSHLISTFKDHELSFAELLVMSDEDLEKIGINQIGVRKKILEASKAVHKKAWTNSSLPNLKQNQYISCPDAVAMMANIAKHLKYISTTVVYIRQQIQSQPRILELAQDTANVHDLLDEMEESLKNVQALNDELRFFKLHLNKVQDNVRYIPADLIIEEVSGEKQSSKKTIVFGFVVLSVTIGGILWKKPAGLSHLVSLVLSKIPLIKGG